MLIMGNIGICYICKNVFLKKSWNQKYCGNKCLKEVYWYPKFNRYRLSVKEDKRRRKIRLRDRSIYLLKDYCEHCYSKERLERHHKTYSIKKSYIITLCKRCHYNIHKKIRNK